MVSRTRASTARGLASGLGACVLWAFTYGVPLAMPATPSFTLTVGRYAAYGALSLALVGFGPGGLRSLHDADWGTAALFALFGNVGYFLLSVWAIRLAGGAVTAITGGLLPVVLAVWGNARRHEVAWRLLAGPAAAGLLGLVLVNADGSSGGAPPVAPVWHALGLACAVGSLAAWAWFGVANADYLEGHPHVSPARWSSVIGVAAFAESALAAGVAGPLGALGSRPEGVDLVRIVAASLVLGVLVSWCAGALWNDASVRLPVSLSGQLLVASTLCGLVLVHAIARTVPGPWEAAGFAISTLGVLWAVRVLRPQPRPAALAVHPAHDA